MDAAAYSTSADGARDFGPADDPKATVSRWLNEIELAEKARTTWVKRCEGIIKRYTEEGDDATTNDVRKRRYSLLYANIQTLAPAVYARAPVPVVLRRWKDDDPIARVGTEVLERAITFNMDESVDWKVMMTSLRDEFLLCGQGQAWVRYVPQIETLGHNGGPPLTEDDTGEVSDQTTQYDEVTWEEVTVDHVNWRDFLTNPARTWAEVRWCARRAFMTRRELVKRFGKEKGEACTLNWKASGDDSDVDTQFSKAEVFEIWDKIDRKAIWISKGCEGYPLDERPDPLELKGFFPCPRPLLGTCGPDSIVPTPDYEYYISQAQQIDKLTKRIGLLSDALKVAGFYAGRENQNLNDLFTSETNALIPIEDWAAMQDSGGLKGVISWLPIDTVATVLEGTIATRKQLIDDVYQVTGIADIMRGDTDPGETLGAQKLKVNWGSSRVRDKQNEIARFARDLLNIMGQIIAKRFSAETLAKMTGVKLFQTVQQKQLVQNQLSQAMQQAQAIGQPAPQPPAQLVRMLSEPTWEEVVALLTDDATRTFRIDIETDSTIEPNDQEEKQRWVEFVQAIGELMAKSLPLVQLEPKTMPMVVELIKATVRKFRIGRESEDVIDQCMDQLLGSLAQGAGQQQQPKGPNPQVEAAKGQAAVTTAQARMMDAQTNQMRAQTERGAAIASAQNDQAQIHAENARTQADQHVDMHMQGQDIAADLRKAMVTAESRRLVHDINSTKSIEVPTE